MKRNSATLLTVGSLLLVAVWSTRAVDSKTDYRVFLDRNPFGLKPPVKEVIPEPPKPPETIKLSGIVSLLGPKRALFVKQEPGAKPEYLSMVEGEKSGAIEVVVIDEVAGTVQIKNGGIAKTLNFKDDGLKATASVQFGSTGQPVPPTGALPGMPIAQPMVNPAAFAPPSMPLQPVTRPSSAPQPSAMPISVQTGGGAVPPITRTMRVAPLENAVPPAAPIVDSAAQTVMIEVTRAVTQKQVDAGQLPPLPPTELSPAPPVPK